MHKKKEYKTTTKNKHMNTNVKGKVRRITKQNTQIISICFVEIEISCF